MSHPKAPRAFVWPSRLRSATGPAIALVIVASALNGCANGPGTLLVDPGRYMVAHCKDLIAQWNTLSAREEELRALQDKASDGTVGTVIGAITYRPDYESVMSQKKLVQRAANAQNCALTPTYQSDQTIR